MSLPRCWTFRSLRTPAFLGALLVLALSTPCLPGAEGVRARGGGLFAYPPAMPAAQAETYKTLGTNNLQLYIFNPKGHSATNRCPAIVFFFGGGWATGSPQQFAKQCQYFASRGMVAITADYRVSTRQHVKPVDCVADAKSAIRWVRKNAARLGVDPNRIVAAGGSAGGHLAACTALVTGLDEAGEDTTVSAVPNAVILFNPALVLAPLDGQGVGNMASQFTADRLGVEPQKVSPAHNIRAGAPPTIIFHGKADTTIPFATSAAFAAKMKEAGNRCELVPFDGQQHGFFNYGRGDNKYCRETLTQADQFLASLGYLSGPPQAEAFLKQ
jgi:acetyl esterase